MKTFLKENTLFPITGLMYKITESSNTIRCSNGRRSMKLIIDNIYTINNFNYEGDNYQIDNIEFKCDVEITNGGSLKFVDDNNQSSVNVKITGDLKIDEGCELSCKSLEL